MHLSRFCTGPTLLCNTLTGILPSKRSNEQMRSESSRTTFQQQIRMFDLLTNDVSFPIRNPLHSMPSLVHLAPTQSELGSSNVNYAGFDIDFTAPDSADDHMNVSDDTLPVPIIEKCSFQRNNIRLPPDIAFHVHLMSQLNKHRGNDLNMFHEIITCMKSHAVHHNVDFSTLQILSRKQLVQLLTKYYQWISSNQDYIMFPSVVVLLPQ